MAKYEKREKPVFVINFDEPVTESVIGGNTLKTKKILIAKIIDNPGSKTVAVMTHKNKLYVLWKGDAYDAIGNWTNEQVESRVRELVLAGQMGE
jgi:hypothetical protein